MSHRGAHNALARLREAMAPGGKGSVVQEWVRNLSDESDFEWKTYLAFHPQCDSIIGPGVTAFAAFFVRAWDQNMQMPRMDFVVFRADFSVVRLHPSSKQHGVPLDHTTISHWLTLQAEDELWKVGLAGALASTQGVAMIRGQEGFSAVHQQDVIGRTQVQLFLNRKLEQWEARRREAEGEGTGG